ncbi:unnamed protein product [Cylindrotheca closterium]|uniref:Uncharacterized protein n=1 Tax=Cylindrotheca closterium TaxID=2856 RepID=A0AAD2GDD3_9STRA|nr:unnamed protein product [Cylindrotheca closterium]
MGGTTTIRYFGHLCLAKICYICANSLSTPPSFAYGDAFLANALSSGWKIYVLCLGRLLQWGPDPSRHGLSDGVQPRQRLELPPAGPPPGPPQPEHTVPFTAKKPLFKSLLPVEAGQSVYEAVLMKKLVRGDSPLLLNPQGTLKTRFVFVLRLKGLARVTTEQGFVSPAALRNLKAWDGIVCMLILQILDGMHPLMLKQIGPQWSSLSNCTKRRAFLGPLLGSKH